MNEFTVLKRLTNAEIIGIKSVFQVVSKTYEKGDIITDCLPNNDTIGIIINGTAYLTTINSEGQNRIIDYYVSGNIFVSHLIPSSENRLIYIIAKTKCTVDFLQYRKVISSNEKHSDERSKFLDFLILQTARKHMIHIDILSQRSLRGKLITFFEYLSNQNNSKTFTLPMPLTDFADYLAVDRSATTRELKKLNDEGIIKSDKRKIKLLE